MDFAATLDTLSDPPVPAESRVAVRVNRAAAAAVRTGHPWVYADSVTNDPVGVPGQLAVVFDPDRQFCGIGLFDPTSPIRVRVVSARQATIDDEWWSAQVAEAIAVRADLLADPDTTAFRLVNGEGDGFGGVVVDLYDRWLSIKVYSPAWTARVPQLASDVGAAIGGVDGAVVRFARSVGRGPVWSSRPPSEVRYLENGLAFAADIVGGQKTGTFLDQRTNRALIRERAGGASVLDLFCCTGGFSVHVAAGGARSVHSVDVSSAAIAATRRHMAANAPAVGHHTTVGDVFAFLDEHRRRYDLVVSDPPALGHSAAQQASAERAYVRVIEGCMRRVRPGGRLFQASCSARMTEDALLRAIDVAAVRAGREMKVEAVTGHGVDHPVRHREGAYLQAALVRLG